MTLSSSPADLGGFATCPSCHTVDTTTTNFAISTGADWRCIRCTQRWDRDRLATAASYRLWSEAHDVSAVRRFQVGEQAGATSE